MEYSFRFKYPEIMIYEQNVLYLGRAKTLLENQKLYERAISWYCHGDKTDLWPMR